MTLYWGPERITIYNDAQRDVLGRLHPDALGLPAREHATGVLLPDDDGGVGGVMRMSEVHSVLDDLKAERRRVASARDAERRRIERDLHDGAQQRLMAIRLELGMLKMLLSDDEPEARAELDRLHDEIGEALDELRELAHGLYPHLLVSDGLYAALVAIARRTPVPVHVVGERVPRLPREIESAAYFCCLEALQNVAKHADGAAATLSLALRDGALEFSIEDDGPGFDTALESDGEGLKNLRDRCAAVDGGAEIESGPGRGTAVRGHIPLPRPPHAPRQTGVRASQSTAGPLQRLTVAPPTSLRKEPG